MYKIYTDGACSGNGKVNSVGGFGVIVYKKEEIVETYGEGCKNTTNNRQELKAILWAIKNYGLIDSFLTPIVYTDSAYALNTLTNWKNDWKRNNWRKSDGKVPENLDLILEYDELEELGYKIILQKVRGHDGIEGNELADEIAKKYCKI